METKEYWERRKKLEQAFFIQLEELRNDLNAEFENICGFEEVCRILFKRNFSEYYEIVKT